MAEVDINAVNEQRVKLGLAPIPVPGGADGPTFKDSANDSSNEEPASTLETREAAAGENWANLQAERQAKKDREQRKAAAKKAREKAQRNKRLAGPTFFDDEDETELSTQQWLQQQKERRKKIEAAEAAMAAEEKAKKTQYTSRDLKGLKVAHELGEFDMESEQILTLKDRNIGEETDEDELENAELVAKEKLKEKLELKKRKPVYNPNDDDGMGEKKMLAQYDDIIDGKKGHQFTLDGKGSTVEQSKRPADDMKEKLNRLLVELETAKKEPVSDYKKDKKSGLVTFKKRVRDPNMVMRKRTVDPDLVQSPGGASTPAGNGTDAMEIDSAQPIGTAILRKRKFDDITLDDDELQRKLAAQRKAKNRKPYVKDEFAKMVLSRPKETKPSPDPEGLYMSYIPSDWQLIFGRNANVRPEPARQHNGPDLTVQQWLDSMDADEYHARQREIERTKKEKEEEELARLRDQLRLPHNGDDMYVSDDEGRRGKARRSSAISTEEDEKKGVNVTEDTDIGAGLGSTLKLLRQRNLLDENAPKTDVHEFRAKQEFLAEKHRREALATAAAREERERQRQQDGYYRMSNREREEYNRRMNEKREVEQALEMADFYAANYKPQVNLRYLDEFNREMNQKEAFKELSHQFHGKGSGAGKREKKLKKIEEEKKVAERTALDMSKYANTGEGGNKKGPGKGPGIRMGN